MDIVNINEEPSENVDNLSLKSARAVILCAIQMLTVKFHLVPLAKILKVNVCGKGKYEMLIPLAIKLLARNLVRINQTAAEDAVSYKYLKRDQLTCETNVELLLKGDANTSSSASD